MFIRHILLTFTLNALSNHHAIHASHDMLCATPYKTMHDQHFVYFKYWLIAENECYTSVNKEPIIIIRNPDGDYDYSSLACNKKSLRVVFRIYGLFKVGLKCLQSRFYFPFLLASCGEVANTTSLQAVYCAHPLHIGAYLIIFNLQEWMFPYANWKSHGYVIILLVYL